MGMIENDGPGSILSECVWDVSYGGIEYMCAATDGSHPS